MLPSPQVGNSLGFAQVTYFWSFIWFLESMDPSSLQASFKLLAHSPFTTLHSRVMPALQHILIPMCVVQELVQHALEP